MNAYDFMIKAVSDCDEMLKKYENKITRNDDTRLQRSASFLSVKGFVDKWVFFVVCGSVGVGFVAVGFYPNPW